MINLERISLKKVFIVLVAVLVILPFLTLAGHNRKIFVNNDANGDQDGSSSHPYKTISQALRRANRNTEVHVSNGTYRENLEVPNGVEISGEDREKTIIEAKNDNNSTVYLKGGANLSNLTIKKGKNGIKVDNKGRVKIYNCDISRNDVDGIFISTASLKESDQVSISQSIIDKNGKNGVYSQKRNVVIYKSRLRENDNDGVVFEAGSKAWIGLTELKDNSGSGMVATLDGASIFTKNVTYSNNKHDGIQINALGGSGRVDIYKSKIRNNGEYGISRINRKAVNASIWSGLTIRESGYLLSHKGDISPIFRIFN